MTVTVQRSIRFPADDYQEILTASKATGISINRIVSDGALKEARRKVKINLEDNEEE